jgi:hypothetical protein
MWAHLLGNEFLLSHPRDLGLCRLVQVGTHTLNLLLKTTLSL